MPRSASPSLTPSGRTSHRGHPYPRVPRPRKTPLSVLDEEAENFEDDERDASVCRPIILYDVGLSNPANSHSRPRKRHRKRWRISRPQGNPTYLYFLPSLSLLPPVNETSTSLLCHHFHTACSTEDWPTEGSRQSFHGRLHGTSVSSPSSFFLAYTFLSLQLANFADRFVCSTCYSRYQDPVT